MPPRKTPLTFAQVAGIRRTGDVREANHEANHDTNHDEWHAVTAS
jgi:hypothetical protein